MIKGIFFNSKNIFLSNKKLFQVLCSYQYRKKTIPIPYPFQERFDVVDGQYLVPKPPLKPLSAYNVFTLMYMRIIRENYPNEPTSVILKKLSSLWNDDEFMIDHKLEVLNLIKYQNYQYYNEMLHYKRIYRRPKLPLSSFQIFLKEKYIEVKEQLQTSDMATITQYVTNIWSNMSDEQKQEYQQKYKDNIVNFKSSITEYDETFKIPLKQYKNIYNLFVIDQYEGKKIKFKDLEEHQKFTRQLQILFNQLTPEEKQVYEQKKIILDQKINQDADKFKKYFDLSEQDYQDIQKLVKSQQKTKDVSDDHHIGFP